MGMILPIIFIVAAVCASAAAVYVAITAVTLVTIILAIVAVSATVASVYYYAQGDLKNSMLFAAIGITAGIGGVYMGSVEALNTAQLLAAEGTAQAVVASEAAYASAAVQMWMFAETTYQSFLVFLEAIHFKTLLEVHQIAYLVSGDYRTMLSGVMQAIANYSEAMGMGSAFMYLCLRDTRNIIMDTSAMLGNKYDMAETVWISSLGEYLKLISTKGNEYSQRPEAFLWDLDQALHRPSIDMMGETTRSIYAVIGSLTAGAKTIVTNAKILEKDLKQLVADLPDILTRSFKPELDKVFGKIDDFIRLSYDPMMKVIDSAFTKVGDMIQERKAETQAITKRIAQPGRYLAEIDELADMDRYENEEILAAIAARGALSQIDEFEKGTAALKDEMNRRIEEQEIEKPPALPETIGLKIPSVPKGKGVKKYTTPFVGEY